MKKAMTSLGKAIRKMTPVYMALLVICGILANAGVKLPRTLQWAYEPVERTTAYATSLVESLETPEVPVETVPTELIVQAGTFWNTHVTATEEKITYVIRVPDNVTPNMPLVVYLHEPGVTSIPQLAQVGVIPAADMYNIHDCIIIQPLLTDTTWPMEYREALVRDLTQAIVNKFYCDESRVVLILQPMYGDTLTHTLHIGRQSLLWAQPRLILPLILWVRIFLAIWYMERMTCLTSKMKCDSSQCP